MFSPSSTRISSPRRSDAVRFFLYLILLISHALPRSIAVFASPLLSIWSSNHFGNPRADFTTGFGPVGVFPRHAQGIPPSIRASFPFVLVYGVTPTVRGRGETRCLTADVAQGIIPFSVIKVFYASAHPTCSGPAGRVSRW